MKPKMAVDEAYEQYRVDYMKRSTDIMNKGYTPGRGMRTRRQFAMEFNALRNENKKLSYKQAATKLANLDTYRYEYGTAVLRHQAAIKAGFKDAKLIEFRAGEFTDTELSKFLSDTGRELKKNGMTSYEIRDYIAQMYFGSK